MASTLELLKQGQLADFFKQLSNDEKLVLVSCMIELLAKLAQEADLNNIDMYQSLKIHTQCLEKIALQDTELIALLTTALLADLELAGDMYVLLNYLKSEYSKNFP